MSAGVRVGAFALLLVAVFAAAALAGRAVDVAPRTLDDEPEAAHGEEGEAMELVRETPPGLSLSEAGLALRAERTVLEAGATAPFRFRVEDGRGATVRDFAVLHERRMHLVVVRRDLTGFQHLHPMQQPDGSWAVPLRLGEPGSYRAFADFETDGRRLVLGVDLAAPGNAAVRPLPAPARSAQAGPYRVSLDAAPARAGETSTLRFRVLREGRAVLPDPYLGARGHLVVLREGDLAYVHAHPEETEGDAEAGTVYETELPSAGRYRLFLQFAHGGSVHTAPFTLEVAP